jgi:hypothetical protein
MQSIPMGYYLLYFFVTVGAKLLLALVMIYFLLPAERGCTDCDGETLLVGGGRAGRMGARLFFGRIQRRWCPRCGWEGLTRQVRDPVPPAGVSIGSNTPTRR